MLFIRDLEFGTNFNVIEAAKKYIVGGKITYIEDEIVENVRAIEYARQLAIYCNKKLENWKWNSYRTNLYTKIF